MTMAIEERIASVRAMLDCGHPKTATVWNFSRGGHRQLRNQCAVCGALVGPVLRASEALPGTPQVNAGARDAAEARYDQLARLVAEKQAPDNEHWWTAYNDYLRTPEWRDKRRRVLERAGGVCEGCGEQRATEVHHETYRHVGSEFLWELRAICSECHSRIHERAA
jgi:hypothetical protein